MGGACHKPGAVSPSAASVAFLNHNVLWPGTVGVVKSTASLNCLAAWHICQRAGSDAGGSVIRILTGVLSPVSRMRINPPPRRRRLGGTYRGVQIHELVLVGARMEQ